MTEDVLVRRDGAVGFLSLNRPQALHALTLEMVHAMTEAVVGWIADPDVEAIVIDHATGRGFCAGGDIAFLRNSALNDGGISGRKFFHDEYRLNHLLFSCPKPVVAFMDGVTMGGGVGISQPASAPASRTTPSVVCARKMPVTESRRSVRPASSDVTPRKKR